MIRRLWVPVFLMLTAGALGMELWAGLDSSPATVPWTELLISLPWWVLMPLALIFAGWLPIHLWLAKKRRTQARQSQEQVTPATQERPGV